MDEECGICYENFTIAATTNCMHTVCYSCFLRNRVLCHRTACLLCSDPIKSAIIYRKGSLTSEQLKRQLHHGYKLKGFESRYFARYYAIVAYDVMDSVNLLDLPPCSICQYCPSSKRDLQDHVRHEHNVEYCSVCLSNKPSFMSDQVVYSKAQLREHLTQHPSCPLCKKAQYDVDSYKDHLLVAHHRCEICRENGISDSYWRTATDLIDHQRNDHYMCLEPACKHLMVAFATQEQLLQHKIEVHSDLFTQAELENTQMRMYCSASGGKGTAVPALAQRSKKRDVTSLINLNRFSLNSRIRENEINEPRFRSTTNAQLMGEQAIFELQMKQAIKNSIATAKQEKMMRETDCGLDGANPQTIPGLPTYDPAIELLARHSNEVEALPIVTPTAMLPGLDYSIPGADISNSDAPKTAIQATLESIFKKGSKDGVQSTEVSTVFDNKPGKPLSQKELDKRYAQQLGIVFKKSVKKKDTPSQNVNTTSITAPLNITIHCTAEPDPRCTDLIQVQDLGQFGASSTPNVRMDLPSQPQQLEPTPTYDTHAPVDIKSDSKTSIQATLELIRSQASSCSTKPKEDSICGIPIVYKNKKRRQNS